LQLSAVGTVHFNRPHGQLKKPITSHPRKPSTQALRGDYAPEFSGTLNESLTLEAMKIMNYKGQNGLLPPGNKKKYAI